MPFCIGSYQPDENIGTSGPGTAVLSVPVPKITSTTGPCVAGEIAVYTVEEVDTYTASPFRMSVTDGAALSFAIVSVWAAALGFRALVKVVRVPDAE